MKIVYIVDSLNFLGGTERIITDKANYLASIFKYDITIITQTQLTSEKNAFELNDQIKQIYLKVPFYSQKRYIYPIRIWRIFYLRRLLRKRLEEAVAILEPDIIIGIGHTKADIVSKIHCKAKIIIECHDARFLMLAKYKPKGSFISRIYRSHSLQAYFSTIERHADVIVTLTEGAKELWNKSQHTVVIPNFTLLSITKHSKCHSKSIIAVGRLRWEKGFDRLINIWEVISLKYPDWQLNIFGDGPLKRELLYIIEKKKIKNLFIRPVSNNIAEEYIKSSIFVSTSLFESFSLVILEAQKAGLPCVSFDCPYGPRTIIEEGKSGYLVEDGNYTLFEEKISCLIEDELLRQQFSAAAIERAKQFDADIIMKQWKELFEDMTSR